ncbi:hypothetical protein Q8A73_000247 [Channa argus]|nr:hypothetical protein Q8A73_000247 [Channa argus]
MVRASVQQDPRAPAECWCRTPTFQPLEGALASHRRPTTVWAADAPSSPSSALHHSWWVGKLLGVAPSSRTLANKEAAELRYEHFHRCPSQVCHCGSCYTSTSQQEEQAQ